MPVCRSARDLGRAANQGGGIAGAEKATGDPRHTGHGLAQSTESKGMEVCRAMRGGEGVEF